jgi:hypothetical protein
MNRWTIRSRVLFQNHKSEGENSWIKHANRASRSKSENLGALPYDILLEDNVSRKQRTSPSVASVTVIALSRPTIPATTLTAVCSHVNGAPDAVLAGEEVVIALGTSTVPGIDIVARRLDLVLIVACAISVDASAKSPGRK